MKYPFYTQSMPVVGSEAERLLSAIDQDCYVANDAALATAKRIAERRKAREASGNYQGSELADAATR
jgi:predicted NAD/FAD-binding protein